MYLKLVPKTKWKFFPEKLERVWVSNELLVQLYKESDDLYRMTVSNKEYTLDKGHPIWKDGISWEDLMAVKKEIGMDAWWGLEAYPPEEFMVNVANMRHIFLQRDKPLWAWGAKSPECKEMQ